MSAPARAAGPLVEPPTGTSAPYHEVSTHALGAGDRIALWEDYNARVLFNLGVRSLDNELLEARQRSLRLPRLTLAKVSTNTHILERTKHHLAQNQVEGVMFFFMFSGESFFHHREGTQIQRPGTILLCDMTQPFIRGFSGDLHEYVLTVPRDLYEQATEGEAPRLPLLKSFARTRGENPHAAELAQLMRRGLSQDAPVDLAETEANAVELLHAMLSPAGSNTPAARRREAVAWIRKHLGNPALSVADVAAGIGVSERTLVRAFSDTSRGVARTILEMRLEHARELLISSPAQVQSVARNCGFTSATHFSRVFRARYDQTPAEVRTQHRISAS